ncbi:MAG: hypothetical protein WC465_04565 [Patescibacteria group bacterium]
MISKQQKNELIEQLKKTPIVQIACEKSGISRATYYRLRKDNESFAKEADQAILQGSLLINDMAESQLITAIKDRNLTAIIMWLKHHHPQYTTKLQVTAKLEESNQVLTPEQQAVVTEALKLAALHADSDEKEQQIYEPNNVNASTTEASLPRPESPDSHH